MPSQSPVPAWDTCLTAFESELTPQQFATWIRPLSCAEEPGALKLLAPNRFVLQWVRDRFGSRIEALARDAAGVPMKVEFAVAEPGAEPPPKPAPARPEAARAPAAPVD